MVPFRLKIWLDLGSRWLVGDYPGGEQVLNQALHLSRDLGDGLAEANALTYLGVVRRLTGDYPGAAQALDQSRRLYRDRGDQYGEAYSLTYGAVVRRLTGDYPSGPSCRVVESTTGPFPSHASYSPELVVEAVSASVIDRFALAASCCAHIGAPIRR